MINVYAMILMFLRFKFVLDKKGNTRYINKLKFEYIMPLLAYKEIQKLLDKKVVRILFGAM